MNKKGKIAIFASLFLVALLMLVLVSAAKGGGSRKNSCYDTDGGNVSITKGTVLGYSGGLPYSNTDYCYNPHTLIENYCSGSAPRTTAIGCGLYGCMNGECI